MAAKNRSTKAVRKVQEFAPIFTKKSVLNGIRAGVDAEPIRAMTNPRIETPPLPCSVAEHRKKLLAYVTGVERIGQGLLVDDEDSFYRLSPDDAQKLTEVWSHLRNVIEHARILPRRFSVIEGGLAKPESTL
ncbi:MAG TPA: hypothetical protein VNK67_02930 [Burkholderiales bacterium]|nr:hypothetical protein [Burkholderiales bacterium]